MKQIKLAKFTLLLILFSLHACEQKQLAVDSHASQQTLEHQQALRELLDLDQDLSQHPDYQDATKGLIAQEDKILIKDDEGNIVWSTEQYAFIQGKAPASVNPSLWRQEKLNNIHGLFEITEGIYQLRGYDLANMTLIKGDTGWIVVDPLTVEETARHAFNFAQQHLGEHPIKAIIYTHSHVDHFGGVEGLVSTKEVQEKNIRIVAPEGFMDEATSENILVGLAMGRRSTYMYGRYLEKSAQGHIGSGLGKSPAWGTISLLEPNEIVDHTGQTLTLDGVDFVFQNTPDAEAPAELTFYLPGKKALCVAELGLRSMHNLYTLRGAKVRDALKWSGYLIEAREMFPDAENYFGSHHWPMWGKENIARFLTKQADGYKFIHDQSVALINRGYTPNEIAEELELPESLATTFSNRGYYGTLKHNAKAIYQNYMGWYDGNPAKLDPLPAEQSSSRYVKLMGGASGVLKAAQSAFNKGDYRWSAELLNHLVFAEPDNESARKLLAKTYQQLGYQAESGPWRDVYLSGAQELLKGRNESLNPGVMRKVLYKTPTSYFLKAMAVNLNRKRAEGKTVTLNLFFEDTNENFLVHIENSVFRYNKQSKSDEADATIYITRKFLVDKLVIEGVDFNSLVTSGIRLEGNTLKVLQFATLMDRPKTGFNIIEP